MRSHIMQWFARGSQKVPILEVIYKSFFTYFLLPTASKAMREAVLKDISTTPLAAELYAL